MILEEMSDFFSARAEMYDSHMLREVEGCREGYAAMAGLVPEKSRRLLDLGCGTGLELAPIFEKIPTLSVTGIDLTQTMLDKLKEKYEDKNIRLICGSYFDVELEEAYYDCAVSFQTMHHFSHEKKRFLYRKVLRSLRPGGCYIEADYMVERQEEEDYYFSENQRLREEQGIPMEAFYHYDTPCTVENQKKLLMQSGFERVKQDFRIENTTILTAWKGKQE